MRNFSQLLQSKIGLTEMTILTKFIQIRQRKTSFAELMSGKQLCGIHVNRFDSANYKIRGEPKAPSTLILFQTKTELFCSGYGYRPHYKSENARARPLEHEYPNWRTAVTMWLQFRVNFAGRYIEMRMRRVSLSMRTEGIKAFSQRIRRCSVDGRERYERDKCGRKYFGKQSRTASS